MAWSIFREGGGKGSAVTWAKDLLSAIGAPQSPGNMQVIYDWEVSEGGGGKYNPLNQGPVPGRPELTTTGSQYGGGAADYASWNAGLQGAVAYLNMPNFRSIKSALLSGNSTAARQAIISSPWAASHYGHGSAFSSAPLPGEGTALPGMEQVGITDPLSSLTGSVGTKLLSSLTESLGMGSVKDMIQRGALILMGTILIVIGIIKMSGAQEKTVEIAKGFVGGKTGAVSSAAKAETTAVNKEVSTNALPK